MTFASSLLRRLEKQRNESIEAFEAAGRPDRAAEERAELAVIQEFLPRLADETKTRSWVAEAIAATQASKPADVGRVMAAVMKAHKGDVDGNLAKKIASELLAPDRRSEELAGRDPWEDLSAHCGLAPPFCSLVGSRLPGAAQPALRLGGRRRTRSAPARFPYSRVRPNGRSESGTSLMC